MYHFKSESKLLCLKNTFKLSCYKSQKEIEIADFSIFNLRVGNFTNIQIPPYRKCQMAKIYNFEP